MEKLTIIMRSVVFNFIFCDIFLKLSILAKTKSGYYNVITTKTFV